MRVQVRFFTFLLIQTFIFVNQTSSQTHIPTGSVNGKWLKQDSPYYIDGEIKIMYKKKLIFKPESKNILKARLIMQSSAKKEVSCKVFTPTFEVLKRKKIDLNLALKNIPYSLDHLLNRHERIEWSVLCNFITNIRPYLSISDFEEMGAVDIREGFNQEYVASGLLMFSLNKFSRRDGENIVKSGEHNVTCIKGEIVSTDNNYHEIEVLY